MYAGKLPIMMVIDGKEGGFEEGRECGDEGGLRK